MSDCCPLPEHDDLPAGKCRCPVSHQECTEVSPRTMAHHLHAPWSWVAADTRYFFCADPSCDVVYFGADGSVIDQTQLRTQVGLKAQEDQRLLCYCYGVSQADFRRDPAVRDYVVAQTAAGQCACDTRNPSGRCCLKDFPRQ